MQQTSNNTDSYHAFFLQGNAIFLDKTNGRCTVKLENLKDIPSPVYKIEIDNKNLVYPTFTSSSRDIYIVFSKSQLIRAKWTKDNSLIKITEVDEPLKNLTKVDVKKIGNVIYVDPKKVTNGIAYDAYPYRPMEITKEKAKRKLQDLKDAFSNFIARVAVYNRHGVVVYGSEKNFTSLLWATPKRESLEKLEVSSPEKSANDILTIKSLNGEISFRILKRKRFDTHKIKLFYEINDEPTAKISLKPQSHRDH